LFVLIFIVFMYYFTCISFAIRPSGRKSAIKLIDWLIDWTTYVCFTGQTRQLNSEDHPRSFDAPKQHLYYGLAHPTDYSIFCTGMDSPACGLVQGGRGMGSPTRTVRLALRPSYVGTGRLTGRTRRKHNALVTGCAVHSLWVGYKSVCLSFSVQLCVLHRQNVAEWI